MTNSTGRAATTLPRCLHCNYSIRGETYNVWVVQPMYNVRLGVPAVTSTGPFHRNCAELEEKTERGLVSFPQN